jgi:tellurite resistance protein TerC
MHLSSEFIFLITFVAFVVGVMMLDLLFIGRKSHTVSLKESTLWSIVWISCALLFSVFLYYFGEKIYGIENVSELNKITDKYYPYLNLTGIDFESNVAFFRKTLTIDFLTGYLIEETLSVDNLFVMLMILTSFSVKQSSYKPVLFWGILGAIVLRFVFIFAGSALVQRFDWILLIFGGYLIYAGINMYLKRNKDEKIEAQHHPLVKILSKRFKIFPRYVGNRFFIRKKRIFYLTPLFVVVIVIEFTDLIFATDSIPAIFSITQDPYIVFFSNIFAIMGLRSLFFLLVHAVNMFRFLKTGISLLLVFVGIKLLFHTWLATIGFKTVYSLYIILAILLGSVLLSLVFRENKEIELKQK